MKEYTTACIYDEGDNLVAVTTLRGASRKLRMVVTATLDGGDHRYLVTDGPLAKIPPPTVIPLRSYVMRSRFRLWPFPPRLVTERVYLAPAIKETP